MSRPPTLIATLACSLELLNLGRVLYVSARLQVSRLVHGTASVCLQIALSLGRGISQATVTLVLCEFWELLAIKAHRETVGPMGSRRMALPG